MVWGAVDILLIRLGRIFRGLRLSLRRIVLIGGECAGLSLLRLGLGVLQLGLQRVSLASRKVGILLDLAGQGFGFREADSQNVALTRRNLNVLLGLLQLGLQRVSLASRKVGILLDLADEGFGFRESDL